MKTRKIIPFEMDWAPMRRSVPEWFRDAKFGLFFHWGPYSVPACENEWYSRNMYGKGLSQNLEHIKRYGPVSEFGYKDFYRAFTGGRFDPDAWAELVVRSGAKYAGPVTEHADNFSMWNSRVNPVNAVNYGPRRDVAGAFAKAARDRGLRFIATFHHQWLWGWFMSSDPDADVYDPENECFYGRALPLETSRYMPWRLPDDAFNRVWMQKVMEVIDAYDPDLVYFDSRANIIGESYKHKLLDYYYNGPGSSKDRIISYKQADFPENTGVRDLECGLFSHGQEFVWQTDDRLEDKRTWCHVEDPRYRSSMSVIHQLCDVVSKNGNLLLNIGPKADGTFEEEAVSVLGKVGGWLSGFGEAIYGTRPFTVFGEGATKSRNSDFDISQIEEQTRKGTFEKVAPERLPTGDIRFTTRGSTLYAILMGQPEAGEVRIRNLAEGMGLASGYIRQIDVVGGEKNVAWSRDVSALSVKLKEKLPSPYANAISVMYR